MAIVSPLLTNLTSHVAPHALFMTHIALILPSLSPSVSRPSHSSLIASPALPSLSPRKMVPTGDARIRWGVSRHRAKPIAQRMSACTSPVVDPSGACGIHACAARRLLLGHAVPCYPNRVAFGCWGTIASCLRRSPHASRPRTPLRPLLGCLLAAGRGLARPVRVRAAKRRLHG